MYNIMNPYFQLASANALAFSSFVLAAEHVTQSKVSDFWHSSLENHIHFLNESTQELLKTLAHARIIMTGHMAKLSKRSEHVASELAHSTVRALAIASHVRREECDRRVFSLPLPGGSRLEDDRRRSLQLASHGVGI